MTASGKTSRCTPWCASSSSPPTSTPGSGAPWTPCATRPTSKNSGPAEPRRGRTGEPPLLGRQARLSDRPHGLQGQLAEPVAAGHGGRGLGFALPPGTPVNLFEVGSVAQGMQSRFGDIRDLDALSQAMAQARPDVVLHLAAQALVPLSYEQPLDTFATNVMGTANVLEAVRRTPGVRAVVAISSDKCYENQEWVWGYRETDPMGGYDPYSASKGCTELVVASYRRSFLNTANVPVASARAGNVIGGGDWTPTRLVPDVLAAFSAQQAVTLRQPGAIRPWQHVL